MIITADNQTKVYGAALPTLTASYTGFANGDTAASLTTQPTLTTTATATSHVAGNLYPIKVSGAADPDYTISYSPSELSVTPAPLTITADDQSIVYGDALPTLTSTTTGFVNGDTSSILTSQPKLSTMATATSGVLESPYPITVGGAAVGPDYSISYVTGNLAVTPAPLTVTANNVTMIYGQSVPALGAIYTGFVHGDTVSSLTTPASLSTTATSASGVGGYPVVASGVISSNYAVTYVNETDTVVPATLTVTPVSIRHCLRSRPADPDRDL